MRVKTDRSSDILELLSKEDKVEVAELAEKLHVTQVTIRKDLDELESRGIIQRERGYATLKNKDDLGTRMAYHYETKRKLAARAAELVSDGETIMIENGSCCAFLAEELTRTRQNLTIVTNSAAIASHIRQKAGFQIILLGGIYQQDSQVMVGPMVKDTASGFFVDKFFIGTDGYSPQAGFTNKDSMRAQAVRDMAGQAASLYVLTESEKFSAHGTVPLNLNNETLTLICDQGIPEASLKDLDRKGIQTILVDTLAANKTA